MKIKEVFQRIVLLAFCAVFVVFGIGLLGAKDVSYAFNSNSDFVLVDELWDGKNFDGQNLEILLKYLTGSQSTTLANFSGKNTQSSTINAFQVLEKQKGQDVVVTLGGLQWTAVYLSKDKNGMDILTLWLSESSQIKSSWSDKKNKGTVEDENPENMYGSSFVRAVALNNGGQYMSDTQIVEVEQDKNHKFASFTIDEEGIDLSDFIVTPQNVSWQEIGQKAMDVGWSHNASNENWSSKVSNAGYYTNSERQNFNYCEKENNGSWKNDKLWLPSLSEVGYEEGKGIWGATNGQRASEGYTWLRTASWQNSEQVAVLYKTGESGIGASMRDVSEENFLRPALHLNLTSAIRSARGLDPFDFGGFPFWAIYVGGGVLLIVAIAMTIFVVKSKRNKKDK